MTEPTHEDDPQAMIADIAQQLLILLFVQADTEHMTIPRRWVGSWLQDLRHVLAVLRAREPP